DLPSDAAGGSALAVEARSGSGSGCALTQFVHPRHFNCYDEYADLAVSATRLRPSYLRLLFHCLWPSRLPTRPAHGPVATLTMKPQRELLPAGPTAASSASSEREATPQSATGTTSSAPRRRPQTKIACTSCRRRKSKCDGQRPVCSLCAGMGRTRCEYDAGPDVTRFAALKTKHEELQRRLSLFEELFRLLSKRSEPESVEIIRRMRTLNMETDLDDLVKFIKNADLLIQLASAQAEPPASGAPGSGTNHQDPPAEDLSSLLELLYITLSLMASPFPVALADPKISENRRFPNSTQRLAWPFLIR
ncbi:hypothetical protein BDP55DRAFT_538684, partial [Colletotrichum godetiae]